MIALGCDHGGFALKEAIKSHLDERGVAYEDFGTYTSDSVDYPRYAYIVARAVASGACELGILCCGTGIGISIAANKVAGARAAVCHDAFTAEMTRRHNDANILCLGGRILETKGALEMVDVFLETPFDGGRHSKRIEQISQIEAGNFKL